MWNPAKAARTTYHFMRPVLWRSPAPHYSEYDLRRLDYLYWNMYRSHEQLHRGLVAEIAPGRVLEVACGTGWNAPNFMRAGFDYCGLDISETAVSLAMRKQPEGRFLNLGIADASILCDDAFDIVYNSSMLEHIGYMEDALLQMARLAKYHLFVIFFEGLSDTPTRIQFNRYSAEQVSGQTKDIFGRKVVLQDQRITTQKGYYWNRYSKADIEAVMSRAGLKYEILDAADRKYVQRQSVLHVFK